MNDLFAKGKANQLSLRANVEEIAGLQGDLRFVHLAAHLEIRRVLSPDQIEKYNELRGYGTKEVPHEHNR